MVVVLVTTWMGKAEDSTGAVIAVFATLWMGKAEGEGSIGK